MFLYVLELCKSVAKRAGRGEEVHARKWKLYAATQDSPLVVEI
jgi:hypothetical protein